MYIVHFKDGDNGVKKHKISADTFIFDAGFVIFLAGEKRVAAFPSAYEEVRKIELV